MKRQRAVLVNKHARPSQRTTRSTLNCRRGLPTAPWSSWADSVAPHSREETRAGAGAGEWQCQASGPTVRSDGAWTRQSSEQLSPGPMNRREDGAVTVAAAQPREGGCGGPEAGAQKYWPALLGCWWQHWGQSLPCHHLLGSALNTCSNNRSPSLQAGNSWIAVMMKIRIFTPSTEPGGEVVDDDLRVWRCLQTVKSSHW